MQKVEIVRLKTKNKSLTEERSSLKRHVVLMEQPVRGSKAYTKNEQLTQAAQFVKERADAAKYKEQAEKDKQQAENDKAQAEKDKAQAKRDKAQATERKTKQLQEEMKDITLASAAKVGKITNSLKEAQDEVSSCKFTIQTAEAKCSELAKATKEIQIAARAAKTKQRTVQEELLLRKE
jgi:hypothetical protein